MQNDSNTYGYNQWFYFSLRNAKKNMKYTFKIANYVLALPFRENPTHSSSWA
jgi:Rad3-related DNA helicase